MPGEAEPRAAFLSTMHDSKLTCSDALESLPLYAGGDLERADLRAVELHLAGCAACASQEAAVRRAREVLRSTMLADADAVTAEARGSLWPSLRERMVAEGLLSARTLAGGRRHPLRLVSTWTKAASIMAAAAALVFVVRTTDLVSLDGADAPQSSSVVVSDALAPIALPVADLSVGEAPSLGNLRRIGPNEALMSDLAEPLQIPSGGAVQHTHPLRGPRESTLAGYR